MEFHLAQNRKENCHHDHIPFNVKGIGTIVFSVYLSQFYDDHYIDPNHPMELSCNPGSGQVIKLILLLVLLLYFAIKHATFVPFVVAFRAP